MIRLLKPLSYYHEKYGTALYGFRKLFLLMEKQHNRGQDGAGIGCVKLNAPIGRRYMFRRRDMNENCLTYIFNKCLREYNELVRKGRIQRDNPDSVKDFFPFGGEVLLGHLRYATSGSRSQSSCHPYFRRSNWITRNLLLAGNFNLTNVNKLNEELVSRGQHPIFDTDTQTILERIGSHLDEAHGRIYREMKARGVPGEQITEIISKELDPASIIREATQDWDGGYVIAGLIGNGDAFVFRDPLGIRPCHYIINDEVIAVASERVPLMTIFGIGAEQVQELKPGHVFVIKNTGNSYEVPFAEKQEPQKCSFERIYFSRGNDPEIYQERKSLGACLAKPLAELVNYDFSKTVFGYIPNTAEPAYNGLLEELRLLRRQEVKEQILKAAKNDDLNDALLDELIMANWPRAEKIALKDIKLRTFISQEKDRINLASHVYDVTYGIIKEEDTLVCVDDSIVRGTTLKESILHILSRTNPKRIIIASTAPQIRYPDCYGIDMSELGKFIAFQATIALLEEQGKSALIHEVYQQCLAQKDLPANQVKNVVQRLYEPFSPQEISKKIAELVYPADNGWTGQLEIVFQGIEALRASIPDHTGDWYFTGKYPTPGGQVVLNKAFLNYYEKKQGRSY